MYLIATHRLDISSLANKISRGRCEPNKTGIVEPGIMLIAKLKLKRLNRIRVIQTNPPVGMSLPFLKI